MFDIIRIYLARLLSGQNSFMTLVGNDECVVTYVDGLSVDINLHINLAACISSLQALCLYYSDLVRFEYDSDLQTVSITRR